jgi:hypothetical protein
LSFVIYSLLLYVSRDFRGMEAFLRSSSVYPRLTNGNVLGVGRAHEAPCKAYGIGIQPVEECVEGFGAFADRSGHGSLNVGQAVVG